MTCEELTDDYDNYALGLIDEPYSGEIRDHLRRECPNCVPGLRGSLLLVTQMASLVKPVDPPARLRRRVLAAVDPSLLDEALLEQAPRHRTGFGWSLVWAASSVLLLIVAVLFGIQLNNVTQLRHAENVRLAQALSLMSAPNSQEVTFGSTQDRPPRGRVVINRRGVLLIVSNLPPLESGKTFELWLIPRGASPIPSGLFLPESDGTGLAVRTGPIPQNIATVAVTIENAGGSDAPTSAPILAASTT